MKVSLAGPLRLRFDYRIFTLQGSALLEAAALLRRTESEVLTETRDTSLVASCPPFRSRLLDWRQIQLAYGAANAVENFLNISCVSGARSSSGVMTF